MHDSERSQQVSDHMNHKPKFISRELNVGICIVPYRRRRIVPEVVLVRRWVVGVLGIWRGEGLGKGETGEVSLQAT